MFKRVNSLLFCTALVGVLLPTMVQAQQPVTNGFRDFSYLTSGGPNNPTAEKPESKLWFNDGIWWGCLFNNTLQEYHIYRFNVSNQSWTDTGIALDDRNLSRADVLWDGQNQHLYVASHIYDANGVADTNSANWGRLYRYSYDSQTKSYGRDANFPVNGITKGRSETLALARDSAGQLWVTYVQSGKIMINRSTTSDLVWGEPFVLPVGQTAVSVTTDDISSIIAFQGNKVGVMWSNQATQNTYFAVHPDANADTAWQTEEIALPGAGQTGAYSDDHINLKTDSTGRVFAATKTSLTTSTSPLVMLLVRSTTGTWTNHVFGTVSNGHTRPIVLLDTEHSRLYMFATAPESGGTIYYKSTDINNIQFATGLGTPFIRSATDTVLNNATSTKQNLSSTTGLLVLVSDANSDHYLHNYLSLGGATNQAPSVNAGANQTITLPSSATLNGTVTDDGLPNPPGAVTTTWSKVSGPGTVTFGNANARSTTASFSTSGSYVLRLTANDSALSATDDITITVNPAGSTNQAPVVNAGADQTITLPSGATLNGTATDDGLPNPPGALTTTWSKVSGPGTVTFTNASARSTTATFSTSGTYVLRLTANDGALSRSDDVTITANAAPLALNITTTSLPNGRRHTAYNQTVQATGGVKPYTWAIAAGSLPQGLSLNSSTGVISGKPSKTGTSSFTVRVSDSRSPAVTDTQALSITVTQ